MLITIADVLSPADLEEVRAMLGSMRFEDGRATAGWSAKLVKDNEQAREGAALTLLRDKVSGAIIGNEVFSLAVRPKALTPLIFARYGPARTMAPTWTTRLMNGLRTDVSFTLFLADPEILRRRRARDRIGVRGGGDQAAGRPSRRLRFDEPAPGRAGHARRAHGGGRLGAELCARQRQARASLRSGDGQAQPVRPIRQDAGIRPAGQDQRQSLPDVGGG